MVSLIFHILHRAKTVLLSASEDLELMTFEKEICLASAVGGKPSTSSETAATGEAKSLHCHIAPKYLHPRSINSHHHISIIT
jgi:hypothetical protein